MPGIQDFTYFNVGKETVRGTPVAPTRKIYAEGTGVLDIDDNVNYHEGENRGVRTSIVRATSMGEDVSLAVKTASGVSYDDLVVPFSQLKGGMTGVGGGADKTWTCQPLQAAANNPEAYSVDVGDDTQNWRVQYAMMRSFKLAAALDDVTSLEASLFGQRAIKTAKATPADNTAPKIAGDLWTIKFAATQAGLAGASISTNFLIDWELEVITGLIWRHYMDGNAYGAQHIETSIMGSLALSVESTALAVSEFVDKYRAETVDFIRLKALGPTLGASNYSAQIDLPVIYDKPQIIGASDEGVNLYKIPAKLAYDQTSGFSIQGVLVNSLAALP